MFGEVVRSNRRRLGLTQQELADRAGLGVRSVRKLEAGEVVAPRPPTVRLLADAFGLTGVERDRFCNAAAQAPRRPVPAHLPQPVPHFAGREDELRRLGEASGFVVVSGIPGVGKSALAIHFGHSIRGRYSDGALYANLRGFDPSGPCATPAEVLTGFLNALGVPAGRVPQTLPDQVNLYRSLLSGRRVLILLDNAYDAEQVRPLLPGAGSGLVVITSRNQLAGLVAVEGAVPLTLAPLAEAEARQLLAGRLGPERVEAEPAAVDEIVTACALLPLALVIVAARAATHQGFPLESLAAELRDSCRLDVLDGGEPRTDVRAAFSWSYKALSPAAATLVRLLGLHPGPDFAAPAAASLAGSPIGRIRPLLAELARANLLIETSPGRYSYHDLLRVYAHELALSTDPEPVRHAALARLLDYYLHSTVAADRLLHPHRDVIEPEAAVHRVAVESVTTEAAARDWLTAERTALVATVRLAERDGFDRHVCPLAQALSETLDRAGHWHDRLATQAAAAAAAGRLGDREAQAQAHRGLGGAYVKTGRLADGRTHLMKALRLFEQLGDQLGQAHTHRNLSSLAEVCGDYAEALKHGHLAHRGFEQAGHMLGKARALNVVGWSHALLGHYADALVHCRQALKLQRAIGDRAGQADTLDSLGYTHHRRGEYTLAIECFQAAIAAYQECGGRLGEAQSTDRLGDCHLSAGQPQDARSAWLKSLELFESLDHADATAIRAKLKTDALSIPA